MKINKFNFLSPLFASIIISFFIVIAFSLMFLYPALQDMVEAREDVITKQQVLIEREAHFLRLKKYKQKIEVYQRQLDKIDSAIPKDAQLALFSLLSFLEETGKKTGMKLVEIKAIRIFPLEDKPEIRKTELSFRVQGSYINFINFLTKIESSVRIIQVKNISFFSPEEGDLFAFDLGISAYSY